MSRIAAVLVTRNASATLDLALRSVRPWVDEVVVVDMHSDDTTRAVAESYGARVVLHDPVGYADPARAFAVASATCPWVIMIDADEVVPPSVATVLLAVAAGDEADAVLLPWRNHMLGAVAAHGPFAATRDRHIRFFKPWALVLSSSPHRKPELHPDARLLRLPVDDAHSVEHFAHRDMSDLLQRADRYTDLQAREDARTGVVLSSGAAVRRATRQFASGYLRHGGFRGGWRGLHLSLFMAAYELVRQCKGAQLMEVGDAAVVEAEYRRLAEAVLSGYEAGGFAAVPAPSTEVAVGVVTGSEDEGARP